jgi:hypothetical protein
MSDLELIVGISNLSNTLNLLEPWEIAAYFVRARAHGMRTYEPRQGRNAATVVCFASAVVTLVFPFRLEIHERRAIGREQMTVRS